MSSVKVRRFSTAEALCLLGEKMRDCNKQCTNCGWNPVIEDQRKSEIKKSMGGVSLSEKQRQYEAYCEYLRTLNLSPQDYQLRVRAWCAENKF